MATGGGEPLSEMASESDDCIGQETDRTPPDYFFFVFAFFCPVLLWPSIRSSGEVNNFLHYGSVGVGILLAARLFGDKLIFPYPFLVAPLCGGGGGDGGAPD